VDETERLTSYLDGGLAADERRALEADLAGDSALRARLQALRAADGALGRLAAAELPDGARQRLDARLEGVLEEVLAADRAAPTPVSTMAEVASDAPTTIEATGIVPDQLAARRRWRALPALTGVAAGLALLAGGVIGLGQTGLLSGSDDQVAADGVESDMSTEEALESAPQDALDAAALPDVPVVIDEGRTTTADDLDELLTNPDLQLLAGRSLSAEEGELLAVQLQQQLLGDVAGGGPGATADADDAGAEEEAEEEGSDEAAGPGSDAAERATVDAEITTRDGQTLPPEDAAAVRRCLGALLEAGEQAVPMTIELLRVDGVPAIAYGLVTLDPQTGAFTRTEVWTLERADCQVLRFTQS
jgi:anti-sigma factor RsiW